MEAEALGAYDLATASSRGGIRQPLDHIFASADAHNWDTGDLAQSSLEVSIVGGHDIDTMLHAPVDNAVVGICTAVNRLARKAFPSFISGDAEGDSVFWSKLFQF